MIVLHAYFSKLIVFSHDSDLLNWAKTILCAKSCNCLFVWMCLFVCVTVNQLGVASVQIFIRVTVGKEKPPNYNAKRQHSVR